MIFNVVNSDCLSKGFRLGSSVFSAQHAGLRVHLVLGGPAFEVVLLGFEKNVFSFWSILIITPIWVECDKKKRMIRHNVILGIPVNGNDQTQAVFKASIANDKKTAARTELQI